MGLGPSCMTVVAAIRCDLHARASLLVESFESATECVHHFLLETLHKSHTCSAQLDEPICRQFVETDARDEELPQCFSLR